MKRSSEPTIARCSMILATESIGPMMKICTDRRGVYVETQYLSPTRVMLVFDMPLQIGFPARFGYILISHGAESYKKQAWIIKPIIVDIKNIQFEGIAGHLHNG